MSIDATNTALAPPDHTVRALADWANERFPPAHGVLVALVWALGVLVGRALTHAGALSIPAVDLAAFPALWAYFLLLRVFDEHKDYERDLVNHPDRVLQSGRITLAQLKALGWLSVLIQAVACVAIDGGIGPVCAIWALLMTWTLLMAKEFFVQWPPERFVLYAFMHMLSMPLALLWLAQIGAAGERLPAGARWLVLLGGLVGATLEVARKFRAPADERPTIDTYTQQLGVRGASLTLTCLLVAAAGIAAATLAAADCGSAVAFAALAAGTAPGIAGAARFVQMPSAKRAQIVEALAGLTVVITLVIVLVGLLSARGIG